MYVPAVGIASPEIIALSSSLETKFVGSGLPSSLERMLIRFFTVAGKGPAVGLRKSLSTDRLPMPMSL